MYIQLRQFMWIVYSNVCVKYIFSQVFTTYGLGTP